MIQIVRIGEGLPDGFENLRHAADAEGWSHLDRLALDRSDCDPLMAAYVDGELAGLGALTAEPAEPGVWRIRRFYVAETHRHRGVGRALASALVQEGLGRSPNLTVHASRPQARSFWEAMGFRLDERNGWSHRYGP